MRIATPEPRVRPDLRFRKELEAQEFGDFQWLSPSLIGLEMDVGEEAQSVEWDQCPGGD